jgi:hypothetical protein
MFTMRDFLKSTWRRSRTGWYWVLILLVLPNCSFNPGGLGSGTNLPKGPTPHDSAIFCEIPKALGRHCATAEEQLTGVRLDEAAVALNTGRTSGIGLDFSPGALSRCGGEPEAVMFEGQFPEGFPVCLNCGSVIGTLSFPDVDTACKAQCYDFFGTMASDGTILPDSPPTPSVKTFCDANARAATNFPQTGCFMGVCTEAGTLRADFIDPRRTPEPVAWTNQLGTDTAGTEENDLLRIAPFNGNYDAGAVSQQWVTRGDAYLEVSNDTPTSGRVIGFTQIPAGCAPPCDDTDPGFPSIGFGLVLNNDGRYYVVESGTFATGPDLNGSFGTYSAGERFRVSLRANGDGTAVVTYSRLMGTCTPGMPCNQVVFYTSTVAASYPLRVDTSLRETAGSLVDVRLVRIK